MFQEKFIVISDLKKELSMKTLKTYKRYIISVYILLIGAVKVEEKNNLI